MLKPNYIDSLPDALVELYAQAVMDILADMARRISVYNFFIPSAEFQFRKLQDMGLLHDEILKKLSAMTGITTKELKKLMKEAGATALKADDSIYRKAGLSPTPLDANPALQAVLQAGIEKTGGLFQNLTRTTANTATKQFENALDRAYMQISTGAFDYNSAIRMAVKDLAGKGVAVVEYPSGHVDYMEVAVRRATVTGVGQTAGKLSEARADEMNCDVMEITAHAGARDTGTGPANHASWQGKLVSRSGRPGYLSYTDIGYGTGEGFKGWNCRHDWFPFFEGISEPAYTKAEIEEMNAKKYTYNGESMDEYTATQKQRYIERQIRRWKREEAGMKAAGLSTDEAKAKVAHWQGVQRDFIKQTGLKRQYDREQVGKAVDLSRISSNKHYQNDPKSGTIITREKFKKGVHPVKQSDIDDVMLNELSGIKFSAKPVYDSRIGTPGITSFELYSWGEIKGVKSIKIGKQYLPGREELSDTLLHEELEARIFTRPTKLHQKLAKSNRDDEIHDYIKKAILRYKRMRGMQ